MNNYNQLLCAPEEFPYTAAELDKLIEREQTIRTQWQLDLEDSWKSASEKGEVSKQKACRYLAVEALPYAIEGVIALLNKLKVRAATKDKKNIELLSRTLLPFWVFF